MKNIYKATRTIKAQGEGGSIKVTVWAKIEEYVQPATHVSPDEYAVDVIELLELEGYAEVYHDDFDLVGDSWHGCSAKGGEYYVYMDDERDIAAWLEAWGVDIYDPDDWEPEDCGEPDGPDPDDQRDEMLERQAEENVR